MELGNPLEVLKECGGYYECPKDKEGKRLGPLVGYAGKYDAPDGTKKAFVGDVYYNFAKAEQDSETCDSFTNGIIAQISKRIDQVDVMLGVPMGGIILAADIARAIKCKRVFAEKKVIAVATETQREQSVLVVERHDLPARSKVVLVEDICNNFSTTDKVVELVEKVGAKIVAIACAINRSPEEVYKKGEIVLPVISDVHVPTKQWKQEDAEVAEDIKKGNVVWKAKNEWHRLAEAMAAAEKEDS